MANGLLDLLGGLGTTPPAYLEGLLGAQPVEDLRKRSIGTGIANALIGYLATPKNQNLGLGRILANTAQAGIGGAKGVYDSATADYMQAQKIEEMNRKKTQREAYDAAFGGLYKTTPAQYENVTESGGYAPQQSEIASGQMSPNFGMTKLPDIVTQREIAPARSEFNQDAIIKMVASGDPRANEMLTGLKLISEFNKKEKDESPFAKVNAGDFTPESVALFNKTNDYSVLRKSTVDGEADKLTNLINIRDRLIVENPNNPNIKAYQGAIDKLTKFAPTSSTNINMPFESNYKKTLGTKVAESQLGEYETANKAANNIQKIDMTLNQIQNSDATTGLGAEVITNVNRFKSQFLADQKAGKKVADTQILDAFLGSDVFPQIGALGIGAKGLDTPAEREFLRQVMTGTINMDKAALVKMTQIRRDVEKRAIEKYNKGIDQGRYDNFFDATGYAKEKIAIPELTPVAPSSGFKIRKIN